MSSFYFVLRLKCGRFTRFDHQVRHESKITLQKYFFLASYCCQFQITRWQSLFTFQKANKYTL